MKYSISHEDFVKTHPQFLNGFTLNNLIKGDEDSAIFTHVDHRFFIDKDTIPLPLSKDKEVICNLFSTYFSATEELEEDFSKAEMLYKLGLLFTFGACFLDIENQTKKPIGVLLKKGCLALIDHKESGRVVEMKTVGEKFEYCEIVA